MNNGLRKTFRLRPKRDNDLIAALSSIENGELSRLVRKGLRMALGDVRQNEEIKKEAPKPLKWNF